MDGSAKPYRLGAFPLVESGTGLSWQRSATSCSMAADAFVLSVVAGLVLYLGVGGLLQGRVAGCVCVMHVCLPFIGCFGHILRRALSAASIRPTRHIVYISSTAKSS